MRFVRWFAEVGLGDVALVGGKVASLGELIRELSPLGIRVPDGFAITAEGYRHFISAAGLDEKISALLERDCSLGRAGSGRPERRDPQPILGAELPAEIAARRSRRTRRSRNDSGCRTRTSRCARSATAEDLPDASFAGQQETYLNVRGEAALLESCRAASPRSSPTAPSATAPTKGSTI